MSKFKSKLARRIMALVLSGAMVMSSMTSSNLSMAGTAYAAESVAEAESDANNVNTGEEISEDEETPEKPENLVDNSGDNEDDGTENPPASSESGNGGGGTSKPVESAPTGNDTSKPAESAPTGNDTSKPAESAPTGNDTSKPVESTPVEGSSVEGSSDEGSYVEGSSVEDSSVEDIEIEPETTYVFEAKKIKSDDFKVTDDLQEISLPTDGYFTLIAKKGKTKLASSSVEFDDAYTTAQQIQFGGAWDEKGNWIKFTTKNDLGVAKVKVWWQTTNNGRSVALYDSAMKELDYDKEAAEKGAGLYITTFTVTKKGEYRIASSSTTGSKGDIRIAKIEVTDGAAIPIVLDGAEIFTDALSVDDLKGEDEKPKSISYVNDHFTVLYGAKSTVDAHAQTFADEYVTKFRFNFRGVVSNTSDAIKFTTKRDEATIKVWWRPNADDRKIRLIDQSGKTVWESNAGTKSTNIIEKIKLDKKGTYYLGGNNASNIYIYKVSVTDGHVEDPVEWDTVLAPEIISAEKDPENSKNLAVTFKAYIDEIKGCEKVTVEMYDKDPSVEIEGEKPTPITSISSAKATASANGTVTVKFTPSATGIYYFIAKASRAEAGASNTHDSAVYVMENPFILPLVTPSISRATNKGTDSDGLGSIEIAYSSVPEATKYFASAVEVDRSESEDGKETYTQVEGAKPITVESDTTTAILPGLTIGKYYKFTVYAYRSEEDISSTSEPKYSIVKEKAEQIWDFSAYGTSTSASKNSYEGNVNDGEVRVWANGNGGKIVPDSSEDGLSFVYTKVDKDTNFTLQATAHVNSWTYSNGQEGFGLMMADAVGKNGDGTTFWNNTYMAAVTKGNYTWDGASIVYEPASNEPASTAAGTRYQMYLGINSIRRAGVTDAWKAEQAAGASKPSLFVTHEQALDATAGIKGLAAGEYNIIGKHTNASKGPDIEPVLTEVTLRIQKNNTGYYITYIDADGKETTNKYYDSAIYEKDYAKQDLLQIDKENIYVGFIAARNADVTFTDISFETVSIDDDEPPAEEPITYSTPSYTILSSSVTNSEEYELQFTSNWQGTLSIKDAAGNELVNEALYKYLAQQPTSYLGDTGYVDTNMFDKFFTYEYAKDENGENAVDADSNKTIDYNTVKLKAGVKALIPIVADVTDTEGNVTKEGINQNSLLSIGANTFTFTFTPDRNWHINDNEKQQLSSYDTSVQTFTVNYRKYGTGESNLYVSPSGKATADGTKEAPLDIYTAVKYVQPGQTIVLMDGTYSLKTPLTIERGIDGTADKPIRMVTQNKVDRSNPWKKGSVVIDFNGVASGMTIAGDYWYFRGFDVTNSSNGDKGIQVSGSHNVLDQINTYYNGNTGIQISRYRGTDADKSDDWPAYNTVLNCTSYLNSDSGYEDADGFAAKLTIGDGNVFDGCIAAYNADDGWDLYAKAESGKIGQVTIQNCVAFKNGYILLNSNGKLDINGTNEKEAGNGNGLKLGGESLKGHHIVLNSYSFLNKANGIESNSCPDIQVFNSVSLDNGHWYWDEKEEKEKYSGSNIAFYTKSADYTEYRANNVISIRTESAVKDNLSPADKDKPEGQVEDFNNASTFYWRTDDATAATNKNNVQITTNDFKDVTFNGLSSVTRNPNGTINMGDFLALKDTVDKTMFVDLSKTTLTDPVGVSYVTYQAAETGTSGALPGMPILGGTETNDKAAEVNPDQDTDGTIDSNDDTDSATSNTWTDEEFAQLDTTGNNTLKILLDLDYDEDGNYYVDYTGTAIKPAVRVAYGTTELSKKNYSVSFKNNIKAYELLPGDEGFNEKLAPTVIIKGKGNYAGQYNLYFTIKKINMGSNDKVVSADISTVATGKSQKIKPVVTFDGKNIAAKEYTVSAPYTVGENSTKTPYTGSYESAVTCYIDFVGANANFTGTKTVKITVLSDTGNLKPMSKVKVDKIPDQIYDGTPHCPAVTVKDLTAPITDDNGNVTTPGDYEIVGYYNNTDVGIASVVLAGNIDRGYYGTKTVTFKTLAKPFNVKDYTVTVEYKGGKYTTDDEYKKLVIPSTTSAVTFGNIVVKVVANKGSEPKILTENVDYTVSYRGNNKAGKASLIIKGMGDFKGTITRTFTIEPLLIDSTNTTVTVADQEYAKGGVKPSVVVKVNGKTISPSYYSVSYKNNNKITTSESDIATVSITGKKLLKGTVKDAAKFKVNPKNLSKLTVSAPDVYYGTAKTKGDEINYATKLVVTDSNGKRLSLGSDYAVNYYYKNSNGERTALAKNGKIPYNGINTTIYAEITKGTKEFYTGTLNTTYNVVGMNDIKTAKVERIVDPYAYNDTAVAVPTDKLIVKIQNRKFENGKYVKDREYKTLTLNTDYKIVNIKNNDRVGTVTVTLQGMGNYCGTNKATFKITKKELSTWNYYIAYAVVNDITVKIAEADVAKYVEEGITFDNLLATAAKISDASGKALTYGTDFTATYTNNKISADAVEGDTKEATVTIKGILPYTGSKTIRFTIEVVKKLGEEKPGTEESGEEQTSSTENSETERSSTESSNTTESSAVESSSTTESSTVESSATESSAVESSATESSAVESSSTTESSAVESSSITESSAVESSSTTESSAVESSSTTESSVVESSATESSAVESSATESSAVESSATESSAVESSATESSAPSQSIAEYSTFNAKAPGNSVLQWFKNLFSFH